MTPFSANASPRARRIAARFCVRCGGISIRPRTRKACMASISLLWFLQQRSRLAQLVLLALARALDTAGGEAGSGRFDGFEAFDDLAWQRLRKMFLDEAEMRFGVGADE